MSCQGCAHVNLKSGSTAQVTAKTFDNNFTQFNGPVGTVIINGPVKFDSTNSANGHILGEKAQEVTQLGLGTEIVQAVDFAPIPKNSPICLSTPPPSPPGSPPTPSQRTRAAWYSSEEIATTQSNFSAPPSYRAATQAEEPKAQLYVAYMTSSYRHIFEKNCLGIYDDIKAANNAAMDEYEVTAGSSNIAGIGGVSKDGGFWWSIREMDGRILEGWVEKMEK